MQNTWSTKNKLNLALLITIIVLVIFGFWGDKVVSFVTSQYWLNFYPLFLLTLIGVALGVPSGLFINNVIEKEKNKKILILILTFIKTELVSNKKNVENLQHAAETIYSLPNISKDDLYALGKFTKVLSQNSYVAAQSSVAFAVVENNKLMDGIVNSYLNIQRIVGGSISFEEVEPEGRKTVLIAYIKLCERTEVSIRLCLIEIDEELKKLGSVLTIVE